MNAAAYVRVSSRSQDNATQRDAIERAAKARGDKIDQWFPEKRTGGKLARPVLDHVREQARFGVLTRLYVFRLDRLTRSGIRDTLNVLEELRAGGCEVITCADGFALDGPFAEIINAVIAWAASMERLALGERIAAARKRVEAAGGAWGRPARVDAATIRKIRSYGVKDARSIRAIAVAVKVPRSTVAAVLSGKGPYATARTRSKKAGKKKR